MTLIIFSGAVFVMNMRMWYLVTSLQGSMGLNLPWLSFQLRMSNKSPIRSDKIQLEAS